MSQAICTQCKSACGEEVFSAPSRHACSPSRASFKMPFCSQQCADIRQKTDYAYLAELDRNASDSECFQHEAWEGKHRIGKCKITGEKVRVEPMQPGDNSGQPKECYEHFVLLKRYQDIINADV